MKNLKLFALSTAAILTGALAQGQARETVVKIDKEDMRAAVISINQDTKITNNTLNQRLQQSGLNAQYRKGVTTYNRALLPEISPDQLDIYTKVEKGPGNSSIVYMAASRGFTGFTNSAADSTVMVNMKAFLESLVVSANSYSVDMAINNEVNEVNKQEKAYQRLLNEQTDLQKKKSNIDSRLLEIQRELRLKEEEITKKKSDLETARTKRITSAGH